MAEAKRKLLVVGYSYDEDDDTLEIELDGDAGSLTIDNGGLFVESFYSQFQEIKAGVTDFDDDIAPVSYDAETDTLTIYGIDGIEADSFYGIIEQIYDEIF